MIWVVLLLSLVSFIGLVAMFVGPLLVGGGGVKRNR